MDPGQEQSDLGLHCLLERLLKHFSRRQKQTTFVVIGLLSVKLYIKKIYDCAASLRQLFEYPQLMSQSKENLLMTNGP